MLKKLYYLDLNEMEIFIGEAIIDIPNKKLVSIEKYYFDVISLRKYLFQKDKKEYENPFTRNKIKEDDLNRILKVDTKKINYFC
jgi:hypothetical protein